MGKSYRNEENELSHSSLYRKIRPRTFGELVGQPHIVRTLINQLTLGQLGHAYLFCGTRGTGKTSVARIFSRGVNCQNLDSGNPCNVCTSCENILAERCMDVVEIDAASNNGVDNIRDLREEVKFLPTQCSYKVYIIDEVHMLSTNAFNALLKTLEEPPAHVIFILATTDQQKVPVTILSRCQRYDFRRISIKDMTEMISKHLDGENISYELEAIDYIAYHADGAMRDALSLLDQCLTPGELRLDEVMEMLGAVGRTRLFAFTDALGSKDVEKVIHIITQAHEEGRDFLQFASDLVRHFRDVMVAGITGISEFSKSYGDLLLQQSKAVSGESLMKYINDFSETIREMRFAPHIRTAFEVCALGLCFVAFEGGTNQNLPERLESGTTNRISPAPTENVTVSLAKGLALTDLPGHFDAFCSTLTGLLKPIVSKSSVTVENNIVSIKCENDISLKKLRSSHDAIAIALAKFLSLENPPKLAFDLQKSYNTEVSPKAQASDEWQGFTKVENVQTVF